MGMHGLGWRQSSLPSSSKFTPHVVTTKQALGVAATSLAAKLDIMLTEDADPTLAARTAHSMVKGGFLVCFQGLISTIGKEHVRTFSSP